MADIAGWGRGTWGEGPWGQPTPIALTGEQLSSTAGTVTVVAEANVSVTGVQAVSTFGDETIFPDANIQVLGRQRSISAGDVTVTGIANVSVTGVSLKASVPPVTTPTFTAKGDAQLSTDQSKFGSASLELDGTDDFVDSDENVDLTSDDFTIDMWIRPSNVTGYKGLWQAGSSSQLRAYLIGDKVRLSVGPSTIIFTSTTAVSANVWTMISIEREGNNHRLYINGTLEETGSTANRPDNGLLSIGQNSFGDFNGYIDEFRLSSLARYEGSSFTEPTSSFTVDTSTLALLHFDGADGSTDIVNEATGGVVVGVSVDVDVTGLQATSSSGSVSVEGDANASPSGIQLATSQGEETVSGDANFEVTGQQLTSTQGDESVSIGIRQDVTGQQLTSASGDVTVTGIANVPVTGVQATTADGSVVIKLSIRVAATGVQLSSTQGSVTVTGTANVSPDGVIINSNSGAVNVWGEVDTSQTSNFTPIADGNTPNWREVA